MPGFTNFLESILERRGISSVALDWMAGGLVPSPYRELLVHEKDMTSTLAAFHDSEIGLEVLGSEQEGAQYGREVLLFAKRNGAPVEYGAIEIQLQNFPDEERRAIVEGHEPLGGIMNRMEHAYVSSPIGYFGVSAPQICRDRFGCSVGATLYGRYNQLKSIEGDELASIVEILPQV